MYNAFILFVCMDRHTQAFAKVHKVRTNSEECCDV